MKKIALFTLSLLVSTSGFAATDHYIRKEGNLNQHLKITKTKEETKVSMDVDNEVTQGNEDKSCTAELSGDAKVLNENELTVKKQVAGEAHYCSLRIILNGDEAKIEPSKDCSYFTGDELCSFDTAGKALMKAK